MNNIPTILHKYARLVKSLPGGRLDGAPWTATCDGSPAQKNLVTPMKATVPMPIQ
jgi:hypothetical protein